MGVGEPLSPEDQPPLSGETIGFMGAIFDISGGAGFLTTAAAYGLAKLAGMLMYDMSFMSLTKAEIWLRTENINQII